MSDLSKIVDQIEQQKILLIGRIDDLEEKIEKKFDAINTQLNNLQSLHNLKHPSSTTSSPPMKKMAIVIELFFSLGKLHSLIHEDDAFSELNSWP